MNDSFRNIHFGDKFSFKRNMIKNKKNMKCYKKKTVYKDVVKIQNILKCQSAITITISLGFLIIGYKSVLNLIIPLWMVINVMDSQPVEEGQG